MTVVHTHFYIADWLFSLSFVPHQRFKPYRKRGMNFYDTLTPKLMTLTFMKVGFNALSINLLKEEMV